MVSPISGCVYDKRLIEKYINDNGSDPMNGEKLSAEMLIDIKGTLGENITLLMTMIFQLSVTLILVQYSPIMLSNFEMLFFVLQCLPL